jgi:hypothetical protein
MPREGNFALVKYEDGTLVVTMAPPLSVANWSVKAQISKRYDALSGVIIKSCASGFDEVSGITTLNAGNGQFAVRFNSPDTSGLTPGNYAYSVQRMDSGQRTVLAEGYFVVYPSAGGA